MPQVSTVGSGGDYSSVTSWINSPDFTTDWGAGNKAECHIIGNVVEAVTFPSNKIAPRGAILTATVGEEFDGRNGQTCAKITASAGSSAVIVRTQGIEITQILLENDANKPTLVLGAFESVDTNVHHAGVANKNLGTDASGIQTHSSGFSGHVEHTISCESGGFGFDFKGSCTNPLNRLTAVDANKAASPWRGAITSGSANNVLTNSLMLMDAANSSSTSTYRGSWSASSSHNASGDETTPGSNFKHNRSISDLADYGLKDFRTSVESVLFTSGSDGEYIGFLPDTGLITYDLTINTNVTGADFVILKAGTDEVLHSVDQEPTTSHVYTYSSVEPIDIGIIKQGWEVNYTYGKSLTAEDSSFNIVLRFDRNYL